MKLKKAMSGFRVCSLHAEGVNTLPARPSCAVRERDLTQMAVPTDSLDKWCVNTSILGST